MISGEEFKNKYLRSKMFPTVFCDGCGIGNVLNYTLRAIEELKLNLNKMVFLSGIGCSSRLPGYVNVDGLHTTHGRALAFATGVKTSRPDLDVVVFTGDGDCIGIGGNHFIHAARRNVNLTVIMVNNYNYGMTGGQVAPTTPVGGITTTTPYGNIEHPFDVCELAKTIGAPYVARWTVTYPAKPIKSIKEAIMKNGFSYVEMLAPCPVQWGRRNGIRAIEDLWNWYDKNTIQLEEWEMISKYGTPEEKKSIENKIKIGIFQDIERVEWCDEWKKYSRRVKKG
jgi:2-oxoglutarate ferredoxin oxidoreductase subunit beta